MSDRKDRLIEERLDARLFRDPDVRALLDSVDVDTLRYRLGEPTHVIFRERSTWDDRKPRPALASDDPAEVCALSRCAAYRSASQLGPAMPGWVHPQECGWCDYPLDMLLEVTSWAVWASGHIQGEMLAWDGADGSTYTRAGRGEAWDNPSWAAFAALTRNEQVAAVQAVVEASRG